MTSWKWLLVFCCTALALTAPAWASSDGDTDPPSLVSFDFAPQTLDTVASAQSITFTVHIVDDQSGVWYCTARFVSPGGNHRSVGLDTLNDLAAGTPQDAVLQGTLSLPRYTESGIWQLMEVTASDLASNSATWTAADLAALGFPTAFTVAPGGDGDPPNLVSLDLTPASIDTSLSPQTITFTAHLTDNLSGLGTLEDHQLTGGWLRSPSQSAQRWLSFDPERGLVAGNPLDGTFVYTTTLPQYSESGVWHLGSLTLVDRAGNTQYISESQLNARGFPTTFTVAPGGDGDPPRLVGFTIQPTSVNLLPGSQVVTFTLHLTDDLSGVHSGGVQLLACSPTMHQQIGAYSTTSSRISGNDRDGLYVLSIALRKDSERGTWHVCGLFLYDNALNQRMIHEYDMWGLGFTTTFQVAPISMQFFPLVAR